MSLANGYKRDSEWIDQLLSTIGQGIKTLRGCSRDNLDRLKQAQQVDSLPEIYQQLMLRAGKEGTRQIYGYTSLSDDVVTLKENALESIIQEAGQSCPQDAFFFGDNLGDDYLMFRTQDGEDPPIYAFNWTPHYGHWFRIYPSFSKFLMGRHIFRTEPDRRIADLEYVFPYTTPGYFDLAQNKFIELKQAPFAPPLFTQIVQWATAKCPGEVQGCTDKEINAMMEAQNTSWLPENYHYFLRYLGQYCLQTLLEKRHESYHRLSLAEIVERLQDSREFWDRKYGQGWISFPEDIFVFGQSEWIFFFFRTKDCLDNPIVYGVTGLCVYKIADSLSEFMYRRVAPDPLSDPPYSVNPVYYDANRDEFLPLTEKIVSERLRQIMP